MSQDVAPASLPGRQARAEDLAGEVGRLLEQGHRLAGLFALPERGDVRLVALLGGHGSVSKVEARLPAGSDRYPSLTPLAPAADWYERAIRDLYGVEPAGHPDPDPLVLPRSPGVPAPAPGSGAGSGAAAAPVTPDATPLRRLVRGEGVFTLPYGPVRSGVFEAVGYVVETPGEDIPRLRVRPHYKHRGVDAAFAGRNVADGALLAERVEGVASVAHAVAYCAAVEQLAAVEVPRRAQLLRALHAELERIANHLDSTLRHTEAAGQAVAHARLGVHKERLMRLRAELCGSRFGRGVVVPGGTAGAPLLAPGELTARLAALERAVLADLALLMATPSFLDRLRNTGVIPAEVAAAHGALGPLGRGSGLEEDVRLSRPYGAYPALGLAAATREGGDALSRQLVRNEEIAAAFHLVSEAIDGIGAEGADGRWSVALGEPSGEATGWAEAPQGEVLYLVQIEGGTLCQVKARSASFHNLALFTAAFPKDITTDFAFIEASFGLSIAGAAL